MSGFQDIIIHIFNMKGFVGPAARTRAFTEIPKRSNVWNNPLKEAFSPKLVEIGGGNDKGG